jgi:hypothetical protein
MKRSILLAVLLALGVSTAQATDNQAFLTFEVDHESVHSGSDQNGLNFIPGVKLTGSSNEYLKNVTIDLKTQIQRQDDTNNVSALIEPRVRYDKSLDGLNINGFSLDGLTVWGRVGLGEKLATKSATAYVTGDDDNVVTHVVNHNEAYAYYTIEPGVTYKVNDKTSVTLSDRYRDAFASGKAYQTNTIYLGGDYKVDAADTVSARLYRKYEDGPSNGFEVSYTRWF